MICMTHKEIEDYINMRYLHSIKCIININCAVSEGEGDKTIFFLHRNL